MTASSKYQILKFSKPIFNASNRAGSGSGPFGDKFSKMDDCSPHLGLYRKTDSRS